MRARRCRPSAGRTSNGAACRRRSTRSACVPTTSPTSSSRTCTFDHIGWASADGAAYFPNATVRCAAADLDYFLAGPAEEGFTCNLFHALDARTRLGPVMDRIETWETDQPLLLGDVVHCPLELMDDDFNLLVDHDRELANRVREAYARELQGTGVVAAAAHFPGLRFGRLLPGTATRRWVFSAQRTRRGVARRATCGHRAATNSRPNASTYPPNASRTCASVRPYSCAP